jgi:hypothetical protein
MYTGTRGTASSKTTGHCSRYIDNFYEIDLSREDISGSKHLWFRGKPKHFTQVTLNLIKAMDLDDCTVREDNRLRKATRQMNKKINATYIDNSTTW